MYYTPVVLIVQIQPRIYIYIYDMCNVDPEGYAFILMVGIDDLSKVCKVAVALLCLCHVCCSIIAVLLYIVSIVRSIVFLCKKLDISRPSTEYGSKLDPFRAAVPCWGQTTQILITLCLKRGCGIGVNRIFSAWLVAHKKNNCSTRSRIVVGTE